MLAHASYDLVRDTAGTLAEACRLWQQVGRPNVMIKVPATPEGMPAIAQLIGPDTVNTMPPTTFDAFRDHGRVRTRLTEDIEEAYDTMDTLAQVGISMAEVTNTLLDEGVQLFGEAMRASLDDWRAEHKVRRLWAHDAILWTGTGKRTLAGYLKAHLSRLGASDYFALLAYIEMNETHERLLQTIRLAVRDARRVATCLGFGLRFLHSTGQAYKGGPNTGVFLQITCDDASEREAVWHLARARRL